MSTEPARPPGTRVCIPPTLMYHSVSPSQQPDPNRLRVHPDQFDRHLRLLHRLGLRGVSLADLLRAHAQGESSGLIGLTFDDAYTDFYEYAAPVLERHEMTGSVFVVAGLLGGKNDWDEGPRITLMDARQIRAVAAAGHQVGSHTMTHRRLTGVDADVLATEIGESRVVLQDVLQDEVAGFAYPYGSFDGPSVDAVRAAGYDHACVTGDYVPGDRFTLPRCYVSPRDRGMHLIARIARHHLRQWAAG